MPLGLAMISFTQLSTENGWAAGRAVTREVETRMARAERVRRAIVTDGMKV